MSQDPGIDSITDLWIPGIRTYVLLRAPKYYRVLSDVEFATEKIRAHVSDYESLFFSCLGLQGLRKAREFDSVDGFVVAVTPPN